VPVFLKHSVDICWLQELTVLALWFRFSNHHSFHHKIPRTGMEKLGQLS